MSAPTEFFTDLYKKFTDLYYKSVVNEDEEPRVPEKVIRCVWNDQLFNTTQLATTDGKALEVIFPGYWNFGSGPDFKSASIKIDGKVHEGDVELHVYGSDWQSHGHSDNNEYDNVILHVYLWRGRGASPSNDPDHPPESLSRPHIHEFQIKPYLKDGILKLNEELDFESYPKLNPFNYGLCHEPLARLSEERFEKLLDAAGDARTQVKMERMDERIITEGYEQTFYEGISEALGYPSNKIPFRQLAERVPISALRQAAQNLPRGTEPARAMEAILFGVSGLLEDKMPSPNELEGDAKTYVASLNKIWKLYREEFQDEVMDPADWKFGKMRPANFPYRRISALAHLVTEHPEGLFENYLNSLNSTISIFGTKGYTTGTIKKLFHHFCVEGRGFWAWHYTAGGKKLQSSQQLIGADRSREIVINIVIPLGLIYARASKSASLETLLGKMYETPARTADNQWIRFMKHYILGDKPEMLAKLNSDRRTQGLMQVYQDYCTRNQNNCLRCRFPGVVDKYFS